MLYIVNHEKLSATLRKLCNETVSIGCQHFEPIEQKLCFWFEEYEDHIKASSQEGLDWLFKNAVYHPSV